MRRLILSLFGFVPLLGTAQTDTSKWLRAFPITDYMVALNDSVNVVQVEMPDGLVFKDKQLGLIYGVYNGSKEDAVQKGYGKCHLIKGNFYYFSIGNNSSGIALKKGDLVYTFLDKTAIWYGRVPQIAAHFIRLQNVYENALFDRYHVFTKWTEQDEKNVVDSMIADIQSTGKYFIENSPLMDIAITSGDYTGKKTFYVMAEAQPADVIKFLDYMIARPRLYAGREWKIAEVFATWLSEGAPMVATN